MEIDSINEWSYTCAIAGSMSCHNVLFTKPLGQLGKFWVIYSSL